MPGPAATAGPGPRRWSWSPRAWWSSAPARSDENQAFGAAIAAVADHLWWWVAPTAGPCWPAWPRRRGPPVEVVLVDHREQAVAWVREHLGPGDAVLYENDLPDHYP